jgi:hypothetical protein
MKNTTFIILYGLAGALCFLFPPRTAGLPSQTESPVRFIMHTIDDFRAEDIDVGDIDNDGKTDIIAGNYWYRAPDWVPVSFRTLEGSIDDNGSGYLDAFMSAPIDVDNDGLLDIVTNTWFSESLLWYRNPGVNDLMWDMTVSDNQSGNHECGELWDIDGDGIRNEVLTSMPATIWYEAGEAGGEYDMIRHVVSEEPRSWGGGVGDLNNDGRPDILRPTAWYEGPEDPRNDAWTEHPLSVGTFITGDHPAQIYVYDVDDDGLNDIVASSGHNYGIFWYKQENSGGEMNWQQHMIDDSWSQAHSLTMADMDNDGDMDLVSGKRFMAHGGSDPGAADPLGLYWYELERGPSPQWNRHVISYGEGVGSAMYIPVADMDADGDLDIVVTGKKGGPFYFESRFADDNPVPGCPDSNYAEYDVSRTVDDSAMCQTLHLKNRFADDLERLRVNTSAGMVRVIMPSKAEYTLTIRTAAGGIAASYKVENTMTFEFSTSPFSRGVHFISVSRGGQSYSRKLLMINHQ